MSISWEGKCLQSLGYRSSRYCVSIKHWSPSPNRVDVCRSANQKILPHLYLRNEIKKKKEKKKKKKKEIEIRQNSVNGIGTFQIDNASHGKTSVLCRPSQISGYIIKK